MQYAMQEPVEVLRQHLDGQSQADDAVNTAATILADRLGRLKTMSPIFEGISFSPDMEAMVAQNLAMTAS